MDIQYLPVPWPQYHLLAQQLAAKILDSKLKFHEIVAISRGGLTLGHLLTDLLGLPISTISIQSYSNIQEQSDVKLVKKLNSSIRQKKVLLVDDVSDSGKTFVRAVSYLKRLGPEKIATVALFAKPRTSFWPDFYAETTSKWILFPYEPTEMIKNIIIDLSGKGKTPNQIDKFLKNLDYSENQIAFTKKYYF